MAIAVATLEGRTVGAYRVARLLGAGAMGKVYLLEHARLPNTFAAIKVLDPRRGDAGEVRERFVQEAMVAAAIGGERVARPLDIGQLDDGTPYIIMEYVAGRTLAEVLDAAGPLPLATALTIAYRVADTIALAHARGIVHRDLKPSNIMLTDEQRARVKVLDFGVARATGEIKLAETRESAVIGSPGYMSPEAAMGATVDARTDVFSLAVTLFKLLTNVLPFAGENVQAVVAAMVTQTPRRVQALRPPALDAAPAELDALLLRALDKDAALRPSMAELRDALLALLRDLAPALDPALLDEAPPPSPALPREIDPLGATVAGADSTTMRAAVERFASARVASRGGPSRRPSRLLVGVALGALVTIAGLITITTLLVTRARHAQEATKPLAAVRHVAPSTRQLTTTGDVRGTGLAPDGRSLAWVAGGALHVLDFDGERTRILASGDVTDADFSGDGKTIYYSVKVDDQPQTIHRVPRDGGAAIELPGFRGVDAQLAPDGRLAAIIDNKAIVITDGEGKRLRELKLDAARFMLWAVRWSPDGQRLLALTGLNDKTVSLMTVDGKQLATLPPLSPLAIQWYDDRTLIYSRRSDAGPETSDLWIQPLTADGLRADGKPRLVAAAQRSVDALLCARECRSAAFISSTQSPNVWAFDVDTAGAAHPRRLDFGTARLCTALIAPDGKRVALGINNGDRVDVMLMPMNGGERRHVGWAQSCMLFPSWAPDNVQLAWRNGKNLDVLDSGTGRVREVSFGDAASERLYAWLDGEHILYSGTGNARRRILDLRSGVSAPYDGQAPGSAIHEVLSPDGTRVAVYDDRLRIVGTDGTQQHVVTTADLLPIGWSRDGAFLYVDKLLSSDQQRTIWRIPVGGGELTRWTTLPQGPQSICSFSRDGTSGLCTEMSVHDDVWLIQNLGELVDAARER